MKDLVTELVADLEPVRPVRMLAAIAQALALEVAVVLVTAWLLGARMAGSGRLADPSFVMLLVTLATGGVLSAVAMTALAIPGRGLTPAWRGLVLALPLLLALAIVALSPWGGSFHGIVAVFVEGFGCTTNTLVIALPAWLAGLVMLRRLRPLDPLRTGLFASFAALFASATVVQMVCPNCDSWHLAVSHYVPILLAAWAGALLSPLLLRDH